MQNNNYKAVNSLDKQSLRGKKKDQKKYNNTMTVSSIPNDAFLTKISFNTKLSSIKKRQIFACQ